MQIRSSLLALLCVTSSLVQAQTDSSAARNTSFKSKKAVNSTKLELVYQKETIKTTGASYDGAGFRMTGANPNLPAYRAPTYSTVNVPYIRINDGELRRLDNRANMLRSYYAKAPMATEQLTLMNQQRRRGAIQGWPLVGIGIVASGVGVYSAVNKSSDDDLNYSTSLVQGLIRIVPGLVIAYAGYALNRYHNEKAKKHLEQSLEIYNKRYYKPIKADSTVKKAVNADSSALAPVNQ